MREHGWQLARHICTALPVGALLLLVHAGCSRSDAGSLEEGAAARSGSSASAAAPSGAAPQALEQASPPTDAPPPNLTPTEAAVLEDDQPVELEAGGPLPNTINVVDVGLGAADPAVLKEVSWVIKLCEGASPSKWPCSNIDKHRASFRYWLSQQADTPDVLKTLLTCALQDDPDISRAGFHLLVALLDDPKLFKAHRAHDVLDHVRQLPKVGRDRKQTVRVVTDLLAANGQVDEVFELAERERDPFVRAVYHQHVVRYGRLDAAKRVAALQGLERVYARHALTTLQHLDNPTDEERSFLFKWARQRYNDYNEVDLHSPTLQALLSFGAKGRRVISTDYIYRSERTGKAEPRTLLLIEVCFGKWGFKNPTSSQDVAAGCEPYFDHIRRLARTSQASEGPEQRAAAFELKLLCGSVTEDTPGCPSRG